MDTGIQILLLRIAIGLIALVKGKTILNEYREFCAWRPNTALSTRSAVIAGETPAVPAAMPPLAVDTRILSGAGAALLNPPADLRVSLSYIAGHAPKPYTFPLGWRVALDGKATCVSAAFIGDVNHVLLSGFTDSGKDSWAAAALMAMAQTTPPEKLQLAIIDGKGGLSWIGWEDKAHVWFMAEEPEEVAPAMEQLTLERQRRQRILKAAKCEKWDGYQGGDLPLIVATVLTVRASYLNKEHRA